ncbi:hypothetical protein IAR55_001502 [Kwoniella newhampshirensis]|uniref:RRM domain-containing protein n=1 Tax=Kwoniella newhampshirensis TaxID=1651941 RepID=A0AAW0Z2A5_9TREE
MNNDSGYTPPAGSSRKSTVYVAGLAPEVNEEQLLQAFVTFGDILDIKLPHEPNQPSKHRGFAFLTFQNPTDAQDAIDNFDLNELPGYQGRGRFLKCSIANPSKFNTESGGNKFDRPIWETEEWQQKYAKPSGEENGDVAAAPAPAEGQEEES